MKLYHWARCSQCRDARRILDERGVERSERDFFADPLDPADLSALAAAAGGIRRLLSTASPSFRALCLDPRALSDDEIARLILAEPRLLRRPLLVAEGGRVLIGTREVAGA